MSAPDSSPPTPSSPNTPLTPLHFGPSSRYWKRERSAIHHARTKSSYSPTAPSLSTERRCWERAHRRAHTQKSSISSVPSPLSECSPAAPPRYSTSPAARLTMARNNSAPSVPHTPAKPHFRNSSLQDSPFSDYFTDDARSVDSNIPSTDTQHLLVRMNKLQSQLMRDAQSESHRDAQHIFSRKLGELELLMNTLHSQTRVPFDVEDSGVFMDDEASERRASTPNALQMSAPYLQSLDAGKDLPPQPVTIEEYQVERDWFLMKMQDLLNGLSHAQDELGQRYTEVRTLNEHHNAEMEEREMQLEQLRSENEGLRSDLGFEYSELLFLKLQMKSLEVDVAMISDDANEQATTTMKAKSESKNRILGEMDRWRSDWRDVNSRFKRRRSRYGVSPRRRDSESTSDGASDDEGDAEWQLETTKEGRGRVTSLTIKRMSSSYGAGEAPITTTNNSTSAINLDGSADTSVSPPTPISSLSSQHDLDGQTDLSQGSSEPQIALDSSLHSSRETIVRDEDNNNNIFSSSHTYVEHATQTDTHLPLQPASQDEEPVKKPDEDEESGEELFPSAEEDDEEEHASKEDDCAITTSDSEDEGDGEEVPDATELDSQFPGPRNKSAWTELWDSLASGMGLDRFED